MTGFTGKTFWRRRHSNCRLWRVDHKSKILDRSKNCSRVFLSQMLWSFRPTVNQNSARGCRTRCRRKWSYCARWWTRSRLTHHRRTQRQMNGKANGIENYRNDRYFDSGIRLQDTFTARDSFLYESSERQRNQNQRRSFWNRSRTHWQLKSL